MPDFLYYILAVLGGIITLYFALIVVWFIWLVWQAERVKRTLSRRDLSDVFSKGEFRGVRA